MIFSLLCAFGAGITIVLSRSVNAALAERIGAYESSFFNYVTGLITSLLFLVLFALPTVDRLTQSVLPAESIMFLGGAIGVINIVILNLVVHKIPPLQLTLLIFIAQLASGIVLDWLLYDQFSMKKMIGCGIVFLGLLHYQYVLREQIQD